MSRAVVEWWGRADSFLSAAIQPTQTESTGDWSEPIYIYRFACELLAGQPGFHLVLPHELEVESLELR